MRLVIVSDTHQQHRKMRLPDGDVLIHCGDFLGGPLYNQGLQLLDFNSWLDELPFEHKILIAGNHDHLLGLPDHAEEWRQQLTDCIYLQDEGVEINGVSFWGSPWTPDFFPEHWVFNQTRGSEATRKRWAMIPSATNVLITHGPPHGILDVCRDIRNPSKLTSVGCAALRSRVRELKQLKLHAFGHIHEGRGAHEADGVRFVNAASSINGRTLCKQPYTVVDL
jgi:Icc-related predicted phosphoesterase